MSSGRTCNLCGAAEFARFRQRTDGVWVWQCAQCGMGVVERAPDDLRALYGDEYYSSTAGPGIGYADYSYSAEHSTAWAASFIRLLCPSGRVLDIGCADGHLLRRLLASHNCYGIEVNPRMSAAAASAGVQVIGSDIFDPRVAETYGGRFDLVLLLAVLEHLPDFRRGVEVGLHLLAPRGVLLLEVPLMSVEHSNDVWFRSSLEHVYYPSLASLHHLFDKLLGVQLAGSEVVIDDYGSTFIGLASRDAARSAELQNEWRRLALGPTGSLESSAEKTFRFLLDVIHAARTTSDRLELLRDFPRAEWNPWLVRRIEELWRRDQERLSSYTGYLRAVEDARDWHAVQNQGKDQAIDSLRKRVEELEIWSRDLVNQLESIQSTRWWRLGRFLRGIILAGR